MKILFLIDNLGSGGAQRQIVTLAALFHNRGHEILFLTYNEGDFFKKDIEKMNIPLKSLNSNSYLRRIFKVRKAIRTSGQDVVISFLETPNFLTCLASLGGREWKVITNERSSKLESFTSIKGKIYKWFERYSDQIITNSCNAANLWKQKYPKYKNKLSTIYNPILIEESNSKYKVRKNNKVHIVFAASYQENKNLIGLIEAINRINTSDRQKFIIEWYGRIEATVGNKYIYNLASKNIKEYGIDNIKLHPETKGITKIMEQADYIGLVSKVEGLPNAICEGMMIGKPIIMSKVSDYSILVDNSNGFLCDPNDINSIKQAILNAINITDNSILAMGKSSKEKANKLFNKDKIVDKWFETINSIEKR